MKETIPKKYQTHPCKLCSKSTSIYKIYCGRECYTLDHYKIIKCAKCNKEVKILKASKNIYCSIGCSSKDKNYKDISIKRKQTIKKRYGVEHQSQLEKVKESKKEKRENGNYKNAGFKISLNYNLKTEEEKQKIRDKISSSLQLISPENKRKIYDKIKKTNIDKYGFPNLLSKSNPERKNYDLNNYKIQEIKYKEILKLYNLELLDKYKGVKNKEGELIYYNFKYIPNGDIFIDHLACGRIPVYKDKSLSIGTSNDEKELAEYIKSILPEENIILNNRKLVKGFEIDIYIPSKNIAIEYNGLYWHSEKHGGKNKNYHLYKTEECLKQDIQLIHIYEDDWKINKEKIKSRLKYILTTHSERIYARKCEIRELNNKIKDEFLDINHLQGKDKSKYKFGLYYNNELISIMTFGNLRKVTGNISKIDHYELIRYSTIKNVIGGASKLLKYFINNYNPKYISSYANRCWSEGNMYQKLGFNFIHNTQPNYWYMKYYKSKIHRFKYRKSELDKLLPIFHSELTEWQNMQNNGFDRIWDCGSKKYEMFL